MSDFTESKLAVAGFFVFLCILFIAVFAPWLSPTNPYDLASVDILDSRLAPGEKMMTGTTAVLGTDGLGRDMLSAMFYGLRISLGVGAMSGIIALCFGVCIGLRRHISGAAWTVSSCGSSICSSASRRF